MTIQSTIEISDKSIYTSTIKIMLEPHQAVTHNMHYVVSNGVGGVVCQTNDAIWHMPGKPVSKVTNMHAGDVLSYSVTCLSDDSLPTEYEAFGVISITDDMINANGVLIPITLTASHATSTYDDEYTDDNYDEY